MRLDVPTLALITSMVFLTETLALLVHFRVGRAFSGLGHWLLGTLLQALGFLAMLALNIRPVWMLAALANPLVIGGQVLLLQGVRRFLGGRAEPRLPLALYLSFLAAYLFFLLGRSSISGRTLVVYAFSGLIALAIAGILRRGERPSFAGSARFAALVFLAYGCLQAAMVALVLALPPQLSYAELDTSFPRALPYAFPIFGSVLWSFAFIIMANQRLLAGVREEKEKLEAALGEGMRAEGEIRKLLAEKELILREVHHRIKNNLGTIYSLLSLQAGAMGDPVSARAFEDTRRRIKSMMMLYESLYESPPDSALPAGPYLSALAEEIIANFPEGGRVGLERRVEDLSLDAKRLQSLGIILNELLTNSMKHAFPGKAEPRILLALEASGGRARLRVEDNGRGFPEPGSPARGSGLGLTLASGLAGQLEGSLQIGRGEGGEGTSVVLDFPL